MSYTKLLLIGVVGLAACGASFWGGRHFAAGGTPHPVSTPGTPPMKDTALDKNIVDGDAPPEPGTCTLTPDELNAQRKQLIPGLFQKAEKVEDIPNGLRFRFAHKPKLVTELATLIEKERVCCSFLSFRLNTEKGEGPITLDITGPAGTADKLRKL